jgi:hypothetical protein
VKQFATSSSKIVNGQPASLQTAWAVVKTAARIARDDDNDRRDDRGDRR